MSESLAEALPREIKRNQELVSVYKELPGNAGWFAGPAIQADIDAAVAALASGDVVEMIRCHQRLEANE